MKSARRIRARIFLSYRTDDARSEAGRLADHLGARFKDVFLDHDTLHAGDDFPRVILGRLLESDAVVAVIGKGWPRPPSTAADPKADDPADWVRIELATALVVGIPTFPVLVNDATMPALGDLPRSLDRLVSYQAVKVSDTSWNHDVRQLADHIAEKVTPRKNPWWPRLALALSVVLVAAVIAAITLAHGPAPAAKVVQPALDPAGTLTVGWPENVVVAVDNLPAGQSVWLVVEADQRYQPDERASQRPGSLWLAHVSAGDQKGIGPLYKLHIVRATAKASAEFQRYIDNSVLTRRYDGLQKLPSGATTIGDPIPLIRK